jgi:rhodanese-related sulfurtransferase
MAITNITPEQLQAMLEQNPELQLVDVRTHQEFQQLGYIPKARLLPLHELPYAFRVLDPTEAVVVTCQHGRRSVDACHFLEAQGFDKLYNLIEGMSSWTGPLTKETEGD